MSSNAKVDELGANPRRQKCLREEENGNQHTKRVPSRGTFHRSINDTQRRAESRPWRSNDSTSRANMRKRATRMRNKLAIYNVLGCLVGWKLKKKSKNLGLIERFDKNGVLDI